MKPLNESLPAYQRPIDAPDKEYIGTFSVNDVALQFKESKESKGPTVVIGMGLPGTRGRQVLKSLAHITDTQFLSSGAELKRLKNAYSDKSKQEWEYRRAQFYEQYDSHVRTCLERDNLLFIHEHRANLEGRSLQLDMLISAGARNIVSMLFDVTPELAVKRCKGTISPEKMAHINEEVSASTPEDRINRLMIVDANAPNFPASGLPIYM